jgi:putative Mn2+ efflux pump MntP
MLQIIGYIAFIIITVGACIGAALLGTIAGLKEEEMTK